MKIGKFFIVVGLALILIGIAYVRALYSHQDRVRTVETQAIGHVSDSTVETVSQQEISAPADSVSQDSLAGLQIVSSCTTDSLKSEIEKITDSLNAVSAQNEKRVNKMIVDFCNGEIALLPADLSRYERNISIKEIKSKAVRYFDIPLDSLNVLLNEAKKH